MRTKGNILLMRLGIMIFFAPVLTMHAGGQEKTENCIMVFGAHADDVELIAGGTFARYISEGYQGIYVCVINNAAGCAIESVGGGTKPPPGVEAPLFSISDSPKSYPVGALETMQIRQEEALRAAAVFNAVPVFLDFRQGYFWQGRKRCYAGSEEYHLFQPPGRPVVSLAELESGHVEYLIGLLRKYSPDIVITHALGGDKHDHGNSAYLMYRAFKEAIDEGVAVGQLWIQPKGWLIDDRAQAIDWGEAAIQIDVRDYLDIKYEALNQHVSQMGIPRKQTSPEELTETFICVLDNTR
jgi:LmbE family N-acetylglucosaminyl deacetylase